MTRAEFEDDDAWDAESDESLEADSELDHDEFDDDELDDGELDEFDDDDELDEFDDDDELDDDDGFDDDNDNDNDNDDDDDDGFDDDALEFGRDAGFDDDDNDSHASPDNDAASYDLKISGSSLPKGCSIKRLTIRKTAGGVDDFSEQRREILCNATRTAFGWALAMHRAIDRIWNQKGGFLARRRRRRDAWKGNNAFSAWFGSRLVTIRQIRVVRRRIIRLVNFFHRGLRIVVSKEQSGIYGHGCFERKGGRKNVAFTIAPRVYICPEFFDLEDSDGRRRDQRRAGVIIHELVHRIIQPPALIAGVAALSAMVSAGAATGAALSAFLAAGHPRQGGHSVGDDTQWSRALKLAKSRPLAARRSPTNWQLLALELGTRSRGPRK